MDLRFATVLLVLGVVAVVQVFGRPPPPRYSLWSRKLAAFNRMARSRIAHEDVDASAPFREDDVDASAPFREDDVDASAPFREDDVDASAPFREDDVDASAPFREDDVDASAPFREDDVDASAPFREDDVDASAPFREDDVDASAPFREDDVDANPHFREEDVDASAPFRGEEDDDDRREMDQIIRERLYQRANLNDMEDNAFGNEKNDMEDNAFDVYRTARQRYSPAPIQRTDMTMNSADRKTYRNMRQVELNRMDMNADRILAQQRAAMDFLADR